MRRLAAILVVASFMLLAFSASCLADTYLELSYGENIPLINCVQLDDGNIVWGMMASLGYDWDGFFYALGTSFRYYNNGVDSSSMYEGLRLYYEQHSGEPDIYSLSGALGYSWLVRDGGLRLFVEAGMQWSTGGSDPGWEPLYGVGIGFRLR